MQGTVIGAGSLTECWGIVQRTAVLAVAGVLVRVTEAPVAEIDLWYPTCIS